MFTNDRHTAHNVAGRDGYHVWFMVSRMARAFTIVQEDNHSLTKVFNLRLFAFIRGKNVHT